MTLLGLIGEPVYPDGKCRWLVVFDRRAATWWADLVALGRRKHVRCFGYIHGCDAWVFYDVQFAGTFIHVARGNEATRLVMEWTADADVLAYDLHKIPCKWKLPLSPHLCTVAVARLLGLPCALRPDALYRECLRHGATIVQTAQVTHGDHHCHDQRSRA